jgi:hypothetical protein
MGTLLGRAPHLALARMDLPVRRSVRIGIERTVRGHAVQSPAHSFHGTAYRTFPVNL